MNIREMIVDLECRGVSIAEISRQAKIHQPALSMIKAGKRQDLVYSAGKRLEALYQQKKTETNDEY